MAQFQARQRGRHGGVAGFGNAVEEKSQVQIDTSTGIRRGGRNTATIGKASIERAVRDQQIVVDQFMSATLHTESVVLKYRERKAITADV